jgi:hypothetical protein
VGDGPRFDNQVASLTLRGRGAEMKLERAVAGDRGHAHPVLVDSDAYALS